MSVTSERTGVAVLMLVLCTIFWGSNMVVGRAVHEDIPPVGLSFWRNVVALLVMVPFTARGVIAHWPVIRRHAGLMFAAGAIGTGLFNVLMYAALETTTAINAALLVALCPVMIPVMAYFILGERLSGRLALGIAVSLVGVAMIITQGELAALRSLSFRPGDLLMVVTMLCWSLYSVLVKKKPPALDPFIFLTAILIFTVPMLLPFYIWESMAGQVMPVTWEAAAASVYTGVFPTALALLFYNRGVMVLGANRVGPYNNLVPVFGTMMAILFLGEPLEIHHIVGAVVIAVALYIATASPKPR